jgi:hypothetical protein
MFRAEITYLATPDDACGVAQAEAQRLPQGLAAHILKGR